MLAVFRLSEMIVRTHVDGGAPNGTRDWADSLRGERILNAV